MAVTSRRVTMNMEPVWSFETFVLPPTTLHGVITPRATIWLFVITGILDFVHRPVF
jgi:hypothetical protein